jgi:large subunit ribosomal protein L4
MNEIKILNNKFELKNSFKTDVDLSPESINVTVVHQIVKATLASRRQGNACTKTKALVSGGGKKPFKQKGTGRARQGSTRSPLMPGGGTVFGPVPRSYEQKVNKKMTNIAVNSVIADKYQAGKLTVLEKIESNGKTKEIFGLLKSKNLLPALIVTGEMNNHLSNSVRNIPNSKYIFVDGFSVYEAIKYENLILDKSALEKLLARLV